MNLDLDTITEVQLKAVTFCEYKLTLPKKEVSLSFPQLLALRNHVNYLSQPENLEYIINTDNFILLFLADKQHLVYLEIPQLLSLHYELEELFYSFNPVLI